MGKSKSVVAKQRENNKHIDIDRLKAIGFQKGKSGNPTGLKPGTIRLSTEIKRVADQVCDETGLSYLHTLITVMFIEAINGDTESRQVLFDRGWGTLIQKNVLMEFNGNLLKMAQEMGLDADDLRGSPVISGLLNASQDGDRGTDGIETPQTKQVSEAVRD